MILWSRDGSYKGFLQAAPLLSWSAGQFRRKGGDMTPVTLWTVSGKETMPEPVERLCASFTDMS